MLFGNYIVISFLASIALLLRTHAITKEIAKSDLSFWQGFAAMAFQLRFDY